MSTGYQDTTGHPQGHGTIGRSSDNGYSTSWSQEPQQPTIYRQPALRSRPPGMGSSIMGSGAAKQHGALYVRDNTPIYPSVGRRITTNTDWRTRIVPERVNAAAPAQAVFLFRPRRNPCGHHPRRSGSRRSRHALSTKAGMRLARRSLPNRRSAGDPPIPALLGGTAFRSGIVNADEEKLFTAGDIFAAYVAIRPRNRPRSSHSGGWASWITRISNSGENGQARLHRRHAVRMARFRPSCRLRATDVLRFVGLSGDRPHL